MTRTAIREGLLRAGVTMRPARLPLGRPDVSTAEILRLRDQRGLTWRAIAERVGMTESGVVTRYRYARRSQPWRQLLIGALEVSAEVQVAELVAQHLGRRPTRAEITAARRAAATLVEQGRAVAEQRRLDTSRGPRLHLVLSRSCPPR